MKSGYYSAIFIIIIFSLNLSDLSAQKLRANNWLFGSGAGLNFSTPVPQPITDRDYVGIESAISDTLGNLLFYTDGSKVYNRNNTIMTNGDGLISYDGNISLDVVIIPNPENENRYYMFSMADWPDFGDIFIHEIDMTNPEGEVILKNHKLYDTRMVYKIGAINHSNKKDVWVLAQGDYDGKCYAFLVTADSVSSIPIISDFGNTANNGDYGQIKFSSDGSKLAIANAFYNRNIFIYHFNNTTGVVSDQIIIDFPYGQNPIGIEFSPNGKLLYASTSNGACSPAETFLKQFNLAVWDKNYIENSEIIIDHSNIDHGLLQLGPDGKIYKGKITADCESSEYIDVISFPNLIGDNCGFHSGTIYLGGKKTGSFLPMFNQSYFKNIPLIIDSLNNSQFTIKEDSCLEISISNFYITDPDNEYPEDFAPVIEIGENYSVNNNSICPSPNYTGEIVVSFRITDGTDFSDIIIYQIEVIPVNDKPSITGSQIFTIPEDSLLTFNPLMLYVEDPDNIYPEDFTINLYAGENFVVDSFSIIPDSNYYGSLCIPITINDGLISSDTFNFMVNAQPVNDAPIVKGVIDTLNFPENMSFHINPSYLIVEDPDNIFPEDFSVILLSGENYNISNDEIIPNNDFTGTILVNLYVFDGSDSSNLFQFPAIIREVNQASSLYGFDINIFPNPASDYIMFFNHGNLLQEFIIEIFNTQGKRILYEQVHGSKIDISKLPLDIYFVKISSEEFISFIKIIKK